MTIALLTAAGTGTRMGQDIPKQFIHIDNKPIIIYTLEVFERNPQIDAIIVVTLENWIDFVWAYAHQFNITKLKWVVCGGKTGQDSIYNGLQKLSENCSLEDIVMIHDGNRCFVSDDIIADSLSVYKKYGSAVASIPCVEAVFKSENGESSNISIPREQLLRTQTPHTYTLSNLLSAHKKANELGIVNTAATCVLMQKLGETVYFSKGSEKNIKITTLDDIDIFRALISETKISWFK